ncbi:hypothetical protein HZS_1853 [Henneguya salminicola]|nr:hypothetical protein HZS_1853 [Henneguya salminicola]
MTGIVSRVKCRVYEQDSDDTIEEITLESKNSSQPIFTTDCNGQKKFLTSWGHQVRVEYRKNLTKFKIIVKFLLGKGKYEVTNSIVLKAHTTANSKSVNCLLIDLKKFC